MHRDIGALERLKSSHEHHKRIFTEAEPAPRGLTISGCESLEVDSGRSDIDAGRVGVVKLDELTPLDVRRRDDAIGRSDDTGFASLAEQRLGRLTRARVIFYTRQSVERNHERHILPLVLQM
jgi:hypothetical protein